MSNPNTPGSSESRVSGNSLSEEERQLAEQLRRSPTAEPSAALDARILAEARAATAGGRRAPRWNWGMGAAAAAVLTLGVFAPIWRAQQLAPVSIEEWPSSVPAGEARKSLPEKLKQDADFAEQSKTLGEARDSRADASRLRDEAAGRQSVPAAAPPTDDAGHDFRSPESSAVTAEMEQARLRGQRGASTGSIAPGSIDTGATETADTEATAAQPAMQSASETDQPAPISAPRRPPSAFPAAPATKPVAAPAAGATRNEPALRAAPEALAPQETGPLRKEEKNIDSELLHADPAAWLAQIEAWVDGNDTERAVRELRIFVTRYPQIELPAKLRVILERNE